MRLLLLSRSAALYSTGRLLRAARARGHTIDVVDPFDLQVGAGDVVPVVYRGHRPPRYDVALARLGTSACHYGLSVLEALRRDGVLSLEDPTAIGRAHDKLATLHALDEAGLPVPRTVAIRSVEGVREAGPLVGGYPVVVKLADGTQGVGTMIAESQRALVPMIETMIALGQRIILQELVRGARGRDLRIIVAGGRVVAAMERRAPRGEFRANIHRGGRGVATELAPAHRRLALSAARAVGLDVAGVDLLVGKAGPVVLEVNATPGLEGIEEVTGVDVAAAIIRRAEARHRAWMEATG